MRFDGPYYIEGGDLWRREGGSVASGLGGAPRSRHVCRGSDDVAVAFDSEDGTLHKCGRADMVQAWAAAARSRFIEAGFEEMAKAITVISFSVTPETVAELNACVEVSGRVLKLAGNLARLQEENPSLASPHHYPAA